MRHAATGEDKDRGFLRAEVGKKHPVYACEGAVDDQAFLAGKDLSIGKRAT